MDYVIKNPNKQPSYDYFCLRSVLAGSQTYCQDAHHYRSHEKVSLITDRILRLISSTPMIGISDLFLFLIMYFIS